LGAYSHLGAESENPSVSEARGRVDVDRRGVHKRGKCLGVCVILRHDSLAVLGSIAVDMLHRGLQAVHYLDGQDEVVKFSLPVLLSG